jgi:hypothetical protein
MFGRRSKESALPLTAPPDPPPRLTPAPAWVALAAAWLGLIALVMAGILPLLPGTRDPRAELEHLRPYSVADRFLPAPVYTAAFGLFVGIIVLWQMRRERRPLEPAMAAQRVQAWTGIGLSLLAAGIVYLFTALRGPGAL